MHMHLTLVLSFPCSVHRKQWAIVLAEMHDMRIDRRRMVNESFVKSMDPEDWTDSRDSLAAFLDHIKGWKKVMTEFSDTFAYRPVDTDNNNNNNNNLNEDR